MALLEIKNVYKFFGGLTALDGLNLDVYDSEILGIIGPNGAGKSTLFNLITGYHLPSLGKIFYQGEDITGLRTDCIAKKGIGRTFQNLSLCLQSTVFDNIFTACHLHYNTGLWRAVFHTKLVREEEKILKEQTNKIIEFMGLNPYREKYAANLSSGFQKALALGVAFAVNPKVLLLDEPVVTLSENRVEMIMELISKMRRSGTTIVIIEHNMKAIMDYCDRIAVIAYGRNIAEGKALEIKENKIVIESYLGSALDAA